ncbi:MAG: hypothetical protein HY011_09090 [Acidobacteria bacterium]|nr:hypothetical protein [Acidobacteriota bacterium]
MMTYEQVLETIGTWPRAARRQLREQLQTLEQQDAAPAPPVEQPVNGVHQSETVEEQIARFNKALNWIREHRAEYLGQWVVLVGDQLISHGPDAAAVFAQAKAAGIETPFLEQIRAEEPAYCGGWL